MVLQRVITYRHVSLSAKLITALPVVMVAAWMATQGEGPWTLMRALGLLLILVGLSLLTLARVQIERQSRNQSGLFTRGVYSRVRHPIYFFSFVAFAGLFLYLNEPRGIPFLLLIQLAQLYRARREEQELEALHGDEYRRYKQQTWF
jgi:protein-S-isoprenylcysteine O-methyltransferase Ste14